MVGIVQNLCINPIYLNHSYSSFPPKSCIVYDDVRTFVAMYGFNIVEASMALVSCQCPQGFANGLNGFANIPMSCQWPLCF